MLDPSHRGTPVETAARGLGCPIEWHSGQLTVAQLRRHPDYRGPQFTALGAQVAVDSVLDPRALDAAWQSGSYDDQSPKRVWHLLARFGLAGSADPSSAACS